MGEFHNIHLLDMKLCGLLSQTNGSRELGIFREWENVNETLESSNILLVTDSFTQTSQTMHKHLGNATKINSLIHSCKLKQTQIRPPLCMFNHKIEKCASLCIWMHAGVRMSPSKSAHTFHRAKVRTDPPKDPTRSTHTHCPAASIYRPSLNYHSKHNMLPPDQSIQLWQLDEWAL